MGHRRLWAWGRTELAQQGASWFVGGIQLERGPQLSGGLPDQSHLLINLGPQIMDLGQLSRAGAMRAEQKLSLIAKDHGLGLVGDLAGIFHHLLGALDGQSIDILFDQKIGFATFAQLLGSLLPLAFGYGQSSAGQVSFWIFRGLVELRMSRLIVPLGR